MKLAVICFTKKGALIGRRLYTYFKAQGVNCEACVPERFLEQDWKADGMKSRGKENLTQWMRPAVFGEKCYDLYRRCGDCRTGGGSVDPGQVCGSSGNCDR